MADISNLTNYLTDVADAIREKKGTDAQIPAANFDTEILSIQTGGDVESIFATVDYSAKNIESSLLNQTDYTDISLSAVSNYLMVSYVDNYKIDIFKLNENQEYGLIKSEFLPYESFGKKVIIKVDDNVIYFGILDSHNKAYAYMYTYDINKDEFSAPVSTRYSHNGEDYFCNYYDTEYLLVTKSTYAADILKVDFDTKKFITCATTPLLYLGNSNYPISNCIAPDIFINVNNDYNYAGLAKFNRETNTFATKIFSTSSQNYIAGVSYDNTKIFIKGKGVYALNSDLSIGNLISNTDVPCDEGYFLQAINDKYYLKFQRNTRYYVSSGTLYEFNNETNEFTYIGVLNKVINHPGHLYTVDVSQASSDIYDFIPGDTQIGISYDGKIYYDTDTNPISSDKILDGYQVYSKSYQPVIGTMPNNGELTYNSSTEVQTIPEGYTSGGTIAAAPLSDTDYEECLDLSEQILGENASL